MITTSKLLALTGAATLVVGPGGGSQNHFMLGAIDEWFTAALGGIEQTPSSVGYADLLIAPAIVGDLTSVTAPLSHAPRLGDQ